MNSGSDLSLLEKISEDYNITAEDEQNQSGQDHEDGCSSSERSRRKRLQVPPALLEKETWRSDIGIRRTLSNIECRPENVLNMERSSRNIRRDHEVLLDLIAGRDVHSRRSSSTGRESPRLKRYQGYYDLSTQFRERQQQETNENHSTFTTLRNLEGSSQSMRRDVTRKEHEFDTQIYQNEEKIISDTAFTLAEYDSQEKYQQNCVGEIGEVFTLNGEEDSSCDSKAKQHQSLSSPSEDHNLEVLHINHNFLHTFEGRDSFAEQSDDSMHISDTDYRREIELGNVYQERQVLVDKEIEISAMNEKSTDLIQFDSLNCNGTSSDRETYIENIGSFEAQHGKKLRIHEGRHDQNSSKRMILSDVKEYIFDEKHKHENNLCSLQEHGDYVSNNSDDCFHRKETHYSQVKTIYEKKSHQKVALLEESTVEFKEVDLDLQSVTSESLKSSKDRRNDRELREEFSRELHNVVSKLATTESRNSKNDNKVFDEDLRGMSPQTDMVTKNNDNGRRPEHRRGHPTRKKRLKRSLSNFELRMKKPVFSEFKNVPANELKEKSHSNSKEAEEKDGIQELVGLIEKDAKINERIRDTLHNIDDNISRSKSRHRSKRTKSSSREDNSGAARCKTRGCQTGFPFSCPGCRDLEAAIEDMKNQSRQLIQYKREACGLREELERVLELLESRNKAVDKVCSKYLWLKERKDNQMKRLQQEVFIMEEILGEALTLLECPRCRSLQQLRPTSSRSQPSLVKARRSRSGFLDTIYRLKWFTEQAIAAKRAKSRAAETPTSGTNLTDDRT